MISWQVLDALTHELELCGVEPGSSVAVLTDAVTSDELRSAVHLSVDRIGVDGVEVRSIGETGPGPARSHVVDALSGASFIINCATEVVTPHADQRVLTLTPAAAQANRWWPHASMRRRLETLEAMIDGAEHLTLTDQHGTELRFALAQTKQSCEHGFVTDPGTSGHFPSGRLAIDTGPENARGQLVLLPGDANVGLARFINSPVRITIDHGRISAVDSNTGDGDSILGQLEMNDSDDPYALRLLSVGMNPGQNAPQPAAFDDVLIAPGTATLGAGTVSLAFGELENPSIRLSLPGRSAHLDGLPIISAGTLLGGLAPDAYETAR